MTADRKDYLIVALTQQRDEAHNRLANFMADANVRIAELMAQVDASKPAQAKAK